MIRINSRDTIGIIVILLALAIVYPFTKRAWRGPAMKVITAGVVIAIGAVVLIGAR